MSEPREYRQCYYAEGVLIPECEGSAAYGKSGCTCRFKPRRDAAQAPIQITKRGGHPRPSWMYYTGQKTCTAALPDLFRQRKSALC